MRQRSSLRVIIHVRYLPVLVGTGWSTEWPNDPLVVLGVVQAVIPVNRIEKLFVADVTGVFFTAHNLFDPLWTQPNLCKRCCGNGNHRLVGRCFQHSMNEDHRQSNVFCLRVWETV